VRGDATGLVVFGKNAGIRVLPPAGAPRVRRLNTLIEKDFTDIQGAIRLATAVFPKDAAKRIVLLSDGKREPRRALEEARAARDQGVEIDVIPISYSYPSEIPRRQGRRSTPRSIRRAFDVRIVVDSTKATRVMLRLFEGGKEIFRERGGTLKAGKNVFVVPRRLDLADRYIYEAIVEPLVAADDGVVQNNGAGAFTFIRGQPKVLLCSRTPPRTPPSWRP